MHDSPFSVFDDPLQVSNEQGQQDNFVIDAFNLIKDTATIFNTDAGKRVLAAWRQLTIESSAWSPSLARQSGLEAANAHAYAREGQNAFVRDIEYKIKMAENINEPQDLVKIMKGN